MEGGEKFENGGDSGEMHGQNDAVTGTCHFTAMRRNEMWAAHPKTVPKRRAAYSEK